MDTETAVIKKETWEHIQAHLERLPVEYKRLLNDILSGETTKEDVHLDTIRRQIRRQMREEEFRGLLEKAEARGRVYLSNRGRTATVRVPKGREIEIDPQKPNLWVRDRVWAECFVNAFMDYRQDLAHGWHSLFTVKHEVSTFREEMIAKLLEGYE